jgi:hypothetical protein
MLAKTHKSVQRLEVASMVAAAGILLGFAFFCYGPRIQNEWLGTTIAVAWGLCFLVLPCTWIGLVVSLLIYGRAARAASPPASLAVAAHADIYCLGCDYPLHVLSTNSCPKCGRPFDPAEPGTFRQGDGASQPVLGATVSAVLFGILLVLLAWFVVSSAVVMRGH